MDCLRAKITALKDTRCHSSESCNLRYSLACRAQLCTKNYMDCMFNIRREHTQNSVKNQVMRLELLVRFI